MNIMEEQIILSVDLYDNALTEKQGDYTGKPHITGTLRNEDIARRIIARGSEMRYDTLLYNLNMADQEKVKAIAEGKSVVDGVGQYLINIAGPFAGATAPFDPAKHKLGVTYTMGKLLQQALKQVKVQTTQATTGPVLNEITDTISGETNNHITSAGPAVINGSNIKVAGDDASVGIFLTKTGGTPQKAGPIIHNNPSQITLMLPTLEDGEYTLSVVTQYASSNKLVKEPRSYTLPVLLLVGTGGGDSESPDEI